MFYIYNVHNVNNHTYSRYQINQQHNELFGGSTIARTH